MFKPFLGRAVEVGRWEWQADRRDSPEVFRLWRGKIRESGQVVFEIGNEDDDVYLPSSRNIADGCWHQVVASWGPKSVDFFINGRLAAQDSAPRVPAEGNFRGRYVRFGKPSFEQFERFNSFTDLARIVRADAWAWTLHAVQAPQPPLLLDFMKAGFLGKRFALYQTAVAGCFHVADEKPLSGNFSQILQCQDNGLGPTLLAGASQPRPAAGMPAETEQRVHAK